MRMRVAHTACIDGVQPGDVGEWDDAHPSVRIWPRAGLLVPVPAPVTPLPAQPARARRKG